MRQRSARGAMAYASMSPSDVLPQDLLATLPPDPAAQHELAAKLAAYAFNARAAGLEAEVAQLRSALNAKTNALKVRAQEKRGGAGD